MKNIFPRKSPDAWTSFMWTSSKSTTDITSPVLNMMLILTKTLNFKIFESMYFFYEIHLCMKVFYIRNFETSVNRNKQWRNINHLYLQQIKQTWKLKSFKIRGSNPIKSCSIEEWSFEVYCLNFFRNSSLNLKRIFVSISKLFSETKHKPKKISLKPNP